MKLQWKVCGMMDPRNIQEILDLDPHYMGFIFYNKSPRYVGPDWQGPGVDFPSGTKKVGVFVNEPLESIRKLAEKHQLHYLQLHGNEDATYCRALSGEGYRIIKALALKRSGTSQFLPYIPWVQYFLFDTAADHYGGTGRTFDWSLLNEQGPIPLPFFLSGGISLENIIQATSLEHPAMMAIDVNSKFEHRPGIKDLDRLSKLKDHLTKL